VGPGSLADPRHPHPPTRRLPRQAAWIHQLGILAQARGDYDEATRHYKRALDIFERLGDQVGMAATYSQLGMLEAGQSEGSAATAMDWHVKALVIRLPWASRKL
jgi:tetratricopeptide (TPR) repeat protein